MVNYEAVAAIGFKLDGKVVKKFFNSVSAQEFNEVYDKYLIPMDMYEEDFARTNFIFCINSYRVDEGRIVDITSLGAKNLNYACQKDLIDTFLKSFKKYIKVEDCQIGLYMGLQVS